MMYVHALSPIHIGAGQGAGVIDLPVIRETTTGWPYLPGSGVKGVLRDACRESGSSEDEIVASFGPETTNADEGAGGVIFPDLHLLFMPVRSARGTLAWVTSLHAINRWLRDTGSGGTLLPGQRNDIDDDAILLPSQAAQQRLLCGDKIRLEERALTPAVDETDWTSNLLGEIAGACFDDPYWYEFFMERAGIVSGDTFTYFTITATEIVAHNRIDDERKIVADGQLWWEEAVPAEAIFTGPILPVRRNNASLLDIVRSSIEAPVQIGGKASVGRGIVRVRIPNEATS